MNGEQLTGTAKWDDILKLYEVEKRNVYHLLPIVTERHIKPSGQDTMKVSFLYLSFRASQLYNTGLFISPSGTSKLDCTTTKTDTAERSISIGRESLKVFFCTRCLGVLAVSTARG